MTENAKNDQKYQKYQKWPKMPKITKNDQKWPKMPKKITKNAILTKNVQIAQNDQNGQFFSAFQLPGWVSRSERPKGA